MNIKKRISGLYIRLVAGLFIASFTLMNTVFAQENIVKAFSAKRIIVLAPHVVEMLFEVGAMDRVVGTTEHSDYPEAALKIPRIGNYARLSIEEILAADPDLIIAWKTGNPPDDLARLKKLGLNIIYSDPHALEDVAKEIAYFSTYVDKAEEGNKISQVFLKRLAELKSTYKDKKAITVFFELWPQPLTTTARKSWSQQQLNVCQVDNPFIDSDADYPQVNIEKVVLSNPQVIIQPSSHGVNAPTSINWLQWPELPAVKNKAFVKPNADKLHRMTSRTLDELETLCQSIDQYRD